MKATVFKRVATSKAGISFPVYTAKLTKKTGEIVYARVHFNKTCEVPSVFPVILTIDKGNANTSTSTYTKKDGSRGEQLHLWVKAYTAEPFVDESIEEFV